MSVANEYNLQHFTIKSKNLFMVIMIQNYEQKN